MLSFAGMDGEFWLPGHFGNFIGINTGGIDDKGGGEYPLICNDSSDPAFLGIDTGNSSV